MPLSENEFAATAEALAHSETMLSVLEELERLHRVVFHALEGVDWTQTRDSAEQILIAEILARHGGVVAGAEAVIDRLADQSGSRRDAVHQFAARVHSYFTTPMGIRARQELFGERSAFITPAATEWLRGGLPAPAPESQDAAPPAKPRRRTSKATAAKAPTQSGSGTSRKTSKTTQTRKTKKTPRASTRRSPGTARKKS